MDNCIFCKIIKDEIQGKFVYKDEQIVAIHDINPKAPTHVLVFPVKHIPSLAQINADDKELLSSLLLKVKEIAEKLGISKSGYKVVVNNGEGSGQMVFHLHFHILGGWGSNPKWEV